MSDKSELEQRLAVVEVKVNDVREHISEMREITLQVKEHLIKQNGALPRLEKSVSLIDNKLDLFDQKLEKHQDEDRAIAAKTEIKFASTTFRVKIIWSGLAVLGSG